MAMATVMVSGIYAGGGNGCLCCCCALENKSERRLFCLTLSALPPSFFQEEEEGKCQFYTKQQLILEVVVLGIQLSVQKRRKGKERKKCS